PAGPRLAAEPVVGQDRPDVGVPGDEQRRAPAREHGGHQRPLPEDPQVALVQRDAGTVREGEVHGAFLQALSGGGRDASPAPPSPAPSPAPGPAPSPPPPAPPSRSSRARRAEVSAARNSWMPRAELGSMPDRSLIRSSR